MTKCTYTQIKEALGYFKSCAIEIKEGAHAYIEPLGLCVYKDGTWQKALDVKKLENIEDEQC